MRILTILGLSIVSSAMLLGALACSATGDNASGDQVATTTAAGGQPGGEGFGGFPSSSTSSGVDEEDACQAVAEEATPKMRPADIVFAIDTSGSMGEESYFVRQEMNNFSQQIINSGIDVRVIMLAEAPPPIPCFGTFCPPGICIDPPLGSGNCPNDSNMPHYIHLTDVEVHSNDGLNVIYDSYPNWQNHLRDDASKTLVVVTDDDATSAPYNNAANFIADFTALDPTKLNGWKMSGIYCFSDCSSAASIGSVWKDIIDQTGGIHGDLCQQQFKPIFDDLATAIIIGAGQLPCQWDIPEPPMNETLDPNKVNVVFTDGNMTEHTILKVANAAGCDAVEGGWFYDNNSDPNTIHLCPASCDVVSQDPDGKIDILFGCETKVAVPD